MKIEESFLMRFFAGALVLCLVAAVVSVSLVYIALPKGKAEAQVGGGLGGGFGGLLGGVLGGKVEEKIDCFCREVVNVGTWIKVGPPRSGEFFVSPFFTREYEIVGIKTGEWVLGTYLPVTIECKIDTVLFGCVKIKEGKLVNIIGSS